MSIHAHLASLESKHRTIENEIIQEMSRPNADLVRLQMLKRKKLQIKDNIEKIKAPPLTKSIH